MQFQSVNAHETVAVQQLTTTTCAHCGILFAMPSSLLKQHSAEGTRFYCPSGHSLCYRKTEADLLREKLIRTQQRLDQQEAAYHDLRNQKKHVENSLRTTRGAMTKIKKRVQNGICPCCNRTFADLYQHMRNKHPNFEVEKQ